MEYLKIEGIQDYLEIFNNKIIISPCDFCAFKNKEFTGDFEVSYDQIYKIDFETAGEFTNGFIHFITKNSTEIPVFKPGVREQSLFLFSFDKNEKMFYVKQAIESMIDNSYCEKNNEKLQFEINQFNEIKKLRDKYESGIISTTEFEIKKKKVSNKHLKNLI